MMATSPTPTAPVLSAATNGDETQLFLTIGSDEVEIGEITDLPDLPSGTQTTYGTTHMKSGRFMEFKKNKRVEGTETDISGNYSLGGDGNEALEAAEDANDAIAYRIVLVEGDDIWDGVGYALFYSLRRSNPADEVRQFTITAKWVTPMQLTKRSA